MYTDLRYALRMLLKDSAVTFVAVTALALGIGANTAIFSVVNAILLRPLPYRDPDQLVQVKKMLPPGGGFMLGGGENITGPEFLEWKEQNQTPSHIAAYTAEDFNLTGGDQPERVIGGRVSATFFPMLGVQLLGGRNFLEEEDRVGGPPVVIISYGLWQRRFGGDSKLVGKTLTLNGRLHTLVGILPSSFVFPKLFEVWLPLALDVSRERAGEMVSLLQVIARLKPGIPLEQARTELDTIRQRLEEENWQRPAVESKNSAPVNLSASRSAPALSDVQAAAVPETTFSLPADGTKIRRAFPRRAKGKPAVSSARESGDNQVEIRSTRSLPRQRQEQRFFAVDKSVSGPSDTFTDQSGPQLGSPSRLLSSGGRVQLVRLHEQVVGNVRLTLLVLVAAVGFVLLIACANVANLLLARAAARSREIAIRAALGASRFRVVRQLLTESVLLGLLGGCLGVLMAFWGLNVLSAMNPANLPRLQPVRIDGGVLGFTLLISILTGFIFGLAPALEISRVDLNESLKEGGRSFIGGVRQGRLRSLLVIAETALTLVLLVSSGLLIRSFLYLRNIKPGFQPEGLLTLAVNLTPSQYPLGRQQAAFFQQVLQELAGVPAVHAVGAAENLPLTGFSEMVIVRFEGHPSPVFGRDQPIGHTSVSPDYFQVLGTPLRRGRMLDEHDNETAPSVALVNEALVRRYFPDEDPIGKRFSGPRSEWTSIVGVVGDIRQNGLEGDSLPEIYRPYLQSPRSFMMLALRTSDDPLNLAPTVRRIVTAIDKNQPVHNLMTMEQRLANSVAPRRLMMLLLGIFAMLALVLAAVGIFGVVSYSVARRTHEIGIRVALGADMTDVLTLVVRHGMKMAIVGIILGLAGSLVLTRSLSSLLFGVKSTDPLTLVAVSLLLAGVALLACYMPARKATRVDPMVALRCE